MARETGSRDRTDQQTEQMTGTQPGMRSQSQQEMQHPQWQQGERGTALTRRTQPSPAPWSPWGTNPFSLMRRLTDEMDRMFLGLGGFGSPLFPFAAQSEMGMGGWAPQVEMFERDNQLVVRADLPGLDKKDVHVEIENGFITIEGERRRELGGEEGTQAHYHRNERFYGSFVRTIQLPEGVSGEDAKAKFKDGVLEVTLPVPKEMRGREIPID